MTYIVGLTGGIGSGKTAASDWFQQQGINIIDTDIISRQIVTPPSLVLTQIKNTFGDWVLNSDQTLNRRALREYIFNNPTARQQLESITHPAIRQETLSQLQQATSPYAILVSPLLFETNQHLLTHRTLLIDVTEDIQLQRASQRDNQSIEQIQQIIQSQMLRSQKQQLADDIISNHGSLEQLYQQLSLLHKKYLNLATHTTQ